MPQLGQAFQELASINLLFLQEDSLDTSGLVFPDMPISRTLLTLSPTQMNVCLLAHYPQLEGKDLEHQALEGEQQ